MIPRSEYPRPDFKRDNWLCLNGEWEFSIEKKTFDKKIIVPYACESGMSGIHDKSLHRILWYKKSFVLPPSMVNKKIILHFGAVDYKSEVWINGHLAMAHVGGQSSFEEDISDYIFYTEKNTIILKAEDNPKDLEQLRGKQFWEEAPRSIFYTRTSGIWQSVWIEAVDAKHIKDVKFTPLFDEKTIKIEYEIADYVEVDLEINIRFSGQEIVRTLISGVGRKGCCCLGVEKSNSNLWNFFEDMAWSPEAPRLFDVELKLLYYGEVKDRVEAYFGMRKVSVENGIFLLNNRSYFQKLILYQGYWPDTLMTAPSDEDFVKDLQIIKEMGFNGLRMHQKVEDPRFYYHADVLGLLVWYEIGSAYIYSRTYVEHMYREWMRCILRDYNHPSIIVWVPLNESWGIQEVSNNKMQQSHSLSLYYLTKSVDDTRLIVDNDGWEHNCSDLLTIHDYEGDYAVMKVRYSELHELLSFRPCGKSLFIDGASYAEQPIILSECGGICLSSDESGAWGYSREFDTGGFLRRLRDLAECIRQSKYIQGYCYTQFCDVETEQNGMLTYDRMLKVDVEEINKMNQLFK